MKTLLPLFPPLSFRFHDFDQRLGGFFVDRLGGEFAQFIIGAGFASVEVLHLLAEDVAAEDELARAFDFGAAAGVGFARDAGAFRFGPVGEPNRLSVCRK